MSIKVESSGAFVYGGLVTLMEKMDADRVRDAKIKSTDVVKKYGFWTYLVIGLFATLNSIFGWFRRYEGWTDPIANGFIYDLPRQGYALYKAMAKTTTSSNTSVVAEAQRIVRERASLAAGRPVDRSNQPEFQQAQAI